MFKRIVLVAGPGETGACFIPFLAHLKGVIQESTEPRGLFLRRRAKRLGWPTVLGQVLFQSIVVPLLKRGSRSRISEICKKYSLSPGRMPTSLTQSVDSINSDRARQALRELSPDLVIVHGTRIVSQETLGCVDCPWVNLHAGITPNYRGTHGAYWALYEGDLDNCGVTLHLVDKGIDTGGILLQAQIQVTSRDNFATYPWIQLGEGLRLLERALQDWPQARGSQGRSRLYYHPTIWQYAWGWFRGVR